MSSDDELVARYLARLDAAAGGMAADRRRELTITIAIVAILVSLAGPIFVTIRPIRHAREPEMAADLGNDVLAPTLSA
jgi:hypothetical protein